VRRNQVALASAPLLLLDLAIHSEAENELIAALVAKSRAVFITMPAGDDKTLNAVQMLSTETDFIEKCGSDQSSLGRLRDYLFSTVKPPSENRDNRVRMFSAPGEGRECIEIVRRILEEVRSGLRFDQIAIFLRSPSTYSGLLDSAFRRAGVPAFFSLGTSRPDPAGRAFLAILACADEKFSAKRFAEYLSLGQVPVLGEAGAPPTGNAQWAAADDELLNLGITPARNMLRDFQLVRADFQQRFTQIVMRTISLCGPMAWSSPIDALLISPTKGLVLFNLVEGRASKITEHFARISNRLSS
jgi:ATP-dependent helicase/nuclease subunit B